MSYLTVGHLREALKHLPDNTPVVISKSCFDPLRKIMVMNGRFDYNDRRWILQNETVYGATNVAVLE